MDAAIYQFESQDKVITPALIYYKEFIIKNIETAIRIAGDAKRLWPHTKTHKTREITELLIAHGVTRFKCATIAEAEVAASCGPTDIILAYPLVGPNAARFIALKKAFPEVRFWAIGDNLDRIRELGSAAVKADTTIDFLVDVNLGQDRTGVAIDKVVDFYEAAAAIDGIVPDGCHCYDGHIHQSDFEVRTRLAAEIMEATTAVKQELLSKGYSCTNMVMGGTPTFPCYAQYPDVFLSPGTMFLSDYGYGSSYREMDLMPAGVVMSRVISRPTATKFTLDLGYKGVASDPEGVRGVIVGLEDIAVPVSQNEEHWIFEVTAGKEDKIPHVGTEVFVIPTHICPTSALYPSVPVVENGKITEYWEIAARNRKITY